MALLNAAGQPVKMQAQTFQIDIPAEAAANMAIDWFAIIPAVLSLIAAFASGNPATIMAAIVAFFKAITG